MGRWILVYWKENLYKSFVLWERHEAMSALIVALAIGLLALATGFSITALSSIAVGASFFIGLGGWFALMVLVITPMRMWKEKKDKLDIFEQVGLELVFDEARYAACRMDTSPSHGGGIITKRTLYRVGVRATGGHTVEGAEVMLKDFKPQGAPFLPMPLHPMNANPHGPSTFTVDPSSTPMRFVEAVEWDSSWEYIRIPYHQTNPLNDIPIQQYTFTLLVHGKEIMPSEKDFIVNVDEQKGLIFNPVETPNKLEEQ